MKLLSQVHSLIGQLPLEEIGRVLVSTDFTVVWCGLTLLYFLVCLLSLVWRAWPIRSALGRVRRALRGIEGPEGFTAGFEVFSKKVEAERSLRHAWREFTETLILPREGDAPRIRNTQEPAIFFNDASIVQPSVHNRFFDTVPSHLVGLGILGTFLGLAAGVGIAQDALSSDDLKTVKDGMGELLRGASLAFTTSIFGLGLSLVFLWIERNLVGGVQRRLGAWVERLEACVELVTAEGIALDHLEQAKRQTRALETFNTDLVFALEKALDERVAQRLIPELEKVVQAVDSLRADRADSNTAAMERMVEDFSRRLAESTGRELDQLGGTLRDLGDRLQMVVSTMDASQQRTRDALESGAQSVLSSLTAGVTAVTGGLQGAAEEFTRTVHEASQALSTQVSSAGSQIHDSGRAAASEISSSLASFNESVARLDRLTTAHADMARQIAELASGLSSAGEVVVRAHRGFEDSLGPTRAVVSSLEAAGARLGESLQATATLVSRAENAAKAMQEEQERMAGTWRDYEERFRGVDEALQRVFQQIDQGLLRYTEQIRTFHTEVDQKVGAAIASLAAATGELHEVLEELAALSPRPTR